MPARLHTARLSLSSRAMNAFLLTGSIGADKSTHPIE